MELLIIYVVMMSVALLIAMVVDKRRAIKHKSRVAEQTLLFLAVAGGAPGGLVGMYLWRHKCRKWYFVLVYWLAAIVWVGGLFYIGK
ncbi:DUF1294 domain-containing protein [Culicoidibacter larvae]|uniref:DUF1294 domain-containing protein n=1 Tax=Culicoidibacter larvae TaxID=2579976 RepID=A0A5R8QH87_9FIRM|nr:DUF1294 domain-containing protein [Culicoidibacter larvae]TLG77401.1 DUF1294 domain-containing protein [Culicoidibacter larvae]